LLALNGAWHVFAAIVFWFYVKSAPRDATPHKQESSCKFLMRRIKS